MTADADPIARLLAQAGLENVEPDEDGVVAVFVDDHLPVMLKTDPAGEQLFLYAGVAELASDRLGEVARTLLDANRLGHEAEGFTLATAPGTNLVFLMARQRLAAASDEARFELFDRFVDAAAAWQAALATMVSEAPDDGPGAEEAPDTAWQPQLQDRV